MPNATKQPFIVTAITIPPQMLAQLDQASRDLGDVGRSAVLRMAAAEFLKKQNRNHKKQTA